MKKICIIAQFPPPIHGLSKAVETLCSSELVDEYELTKIDISNNHHFVSNLFRIVYCNDDLYYFTISQSILGNIRDLIILFVLRLKKCKTVVHLHGGYYKTLFERDMCAIQRRLNKELFSRIDAAIVLSERFMDPFFRMLPESKVYVVSNCVDEEFIISDDEFNIKLLNNEKNRIRHILYLSNFVRSKGYRYVLQLAVIEKHRYENGQERKYHFDFSGAFLDREEERFFFDFIEKKKLKPYVSYHGISSGLQKRDLLKNSDYLILLTSYPKEGQPICILEGMANGLTIISTDHAGITDVVKNENGIIIESDRIDSVDLYDSIEKRDISRIAIANRKKIQEKYMRSNYIDSIKKIWSKVIENE